MSYSFRTSSHGRYFGSRADGSIGLHNIRAAEFLLVLRLMENSYLTDLTAERISARCINVTQNYIKSRSMLFEKWNYIDRKPISNGEKRLCYTYKLAAAGKRFIDAIPVEIHNKIMIALAEKSADLMALRDSRLSKVLALQSVVDKGRRKVFVDSRLNDPLPEYVLATLPKQTPIPQPEPEQPSRHPVEFIGFQSGDRKYVCDLSLPNYNSREVGFWPAWCIGRSSGAGPMSLFKDIKSGEVVLHFEDGEIIRG